MKLASDTLNLVAVAYAQRTSEDTGGAFCARSPALKCKRVSGVPYESASDDRAVLTNRGINRVFSIGRSLSHPRECRNSGAIEGHTEVMATASE